MTVGIALYNLFNGCTAFHCIDVLQFLKINSNMSCVLEMQWPKQTWCLPSWD